MAIKIELISADKAGEILERTLKIRDPELWQTRRRNAAKARARARKEGAPVRRAGWQPVRMNMGNGQVIERRPMEMLGLGDLNRPISSARADLYLEEMQADRWYFSPDPVVISEQGYVINGQHRLVAADAVDWSKVAEIPRFLVVWGADKKTALLMDEAKRSTTDRREIALGYARAS
jgi:hypothetical protein